MVFFTANHRQTDLAGTRWHAFYADERTHISTHSEEGNKLWEKGRSVSFRQSVELPAGPKEGVVYHLGGGRGWGVGIDPRKLKMEEEASDISLVL